MQEHVFSVDLEQQTVTSPSGQTFRFEIDAARKEKMLKGLDAIGETLVHAGAIDRFEEKRRMSRANGSGEDNPESGRHGNSHMVPFVTLLPFVRQLFIFLPTSHSCALRLFSI